MSDSADHVAGQPVTVTINDKEYTFTPLQINEFLGEAAARIRSDAIQAAWDGLATGDPDAKRDIVARVATRNISVQQVMDWVQTYEGACWLIWKSLRKRHKDVTINTVKAFDFNEIYDLVMSINGLEESRGNPPAEEQTLT